MQLANQIALLEQLLAHYLALATDSRHARDIENVSGELTRFSKAPLFLEAALILLLQGGGRREKDILLSSLIKDKFKYDFETVREEGLQDYYQQLCQIACLPRLIGSVAAKNTCLALAYIYINLSAARPLALPTFLHPLLPKHPERDDSTAYFTALEYIASEIDNSRVVVDEESRQLARQRAVEQQQPVLEMLNDQGRALLQANRIENAMLECFACWVDISYNPGILNSLPSHCLMEALFRQLLGADEDASYAACRCIKVVIQLIRDQQENAAIIAYLGINLVPLLAQIERCLARNDTPQAELYIQLLLAFSGKSLRLLTAAPSPDSLDFLRTLARLTRLPALDSPDTPDTFDYFVDFWDKLLEELNRLVDSHQPYHYRNLNPGLEAVLLELYDSLLQHCTYSPRIIAALQKRSEDSLAKQEHETEMIADHRAKCSELFRKMSTYLSHEKFLHHACGKIRSLGEAAKGPDFWGTLEGIICSLTQPLRKLPSVNEDVTLLANTYGEISKCEETPLAVRRTFLRLFRGLMNVREKDELFIKRLFFYASTCFEVEQLAEQAERTFCRGCELNGYIMVPALPEFLSLMKDYLNREHIVRGVFAIITSHPQAVDCYLLDALLALRDGADDRNVSESVHRSRLTALIEVSKLLKDSTAAQERLDIVAEFVRRSLPFLRRELASGKTKDDENLEVERAVKLIKNLMRCLRLAFWPFAGELYSFAMQAFQAQPVCSYVYLVEVAITVFAKEPSCEDFLLSLYTQFCEQTYRHLSEANRERLSLLLDDFVGMNKRFFIFNPSLVLKSGQLPLFLDHCLEFLSSDTPRVARATYSFFETIFMIYWPAPFIDEFNQREDDHESIRFAPEDLPLYEQLKEELRDKVHYILAKMLLRLSEVPNSAVRNGIIDTVHAELKAFPEWNGEIWDHLIAPLPNDILLAREKEDFMALIAHTYQQPHPVVDRAQQALERMVDLIYKRMTAAAKRRNYGIAK